MGAHNVGHVEQGHGQQGDQHEHQQCHRQRRITQVRQQTSHLQTSSPDSTIAVRLGGVKIRKRESSRTGWLLVLESQVSS